MDSVRIPQADTDEHTLLIEGMTCASCVTRLERVLRKVPGVLDAWVNLATEKARIQSTGVPVSALIAAVQKAGFDAHIDPTARVPVGDSSVPESSPAESSPAESSLVGSLPTFRVFLAHYDRCGHRHRFGRSCYRLC